MPDAIRCYTAFMRDIGSLAREHVRGELACGWSASALRISTDPRCSVRASIDDANPSPSVETIQPLTITQTFSIHFIEPPQGSAEQNSGQSPEDNVA